MTSLVHPLPAANVQQALDHRRPGCRCWACLETEEVAHSIMSVSMWPFRLRIWHALLQTCQLVTDRIRVPRLSAVEDAGMPAQRCPTAGLSNNSMSPEACQHAHILEHLQVLKGMVLGLLLGRAPTLLWEGWQLLRRVPAPHSLCCHCCHTSGVATAA